MMVVVLAAEAAVDKQTNQKSSILLGVHLGGCVCVCAHVAGETAILLLLHTPHFLSLSYGTNQPIIPGESFFFRIRIVITCYFVRLLLGYRFTFRPRQEIEILYWLLIDRWNRSRPSRFSFQEFPSFLPSSMYMQDIDEKKKCIYCLLRVFVVLCCVVCERIVSLEHTFMISKIVLLLL